MCVMTFFFQAEDGIRDTSVTGVQTCALPIFVTLKPKTGDQPYSAATIWIRRDDGLVQRMEIAETSGQDRTVVLTNLKVNAGVPGREFTFSPPAGVRVVDQ